MPGQKKIYDLYGSLFGDNEVSATFSMRKKLINCKGSLMKFSDAIRYEGVEGLRAYYTHRFGNSRADNLLKRVFVLCFNELFISGKYDDRFSDEQISCSTGDLLKL